MFNIIEFIKEKLGINKTNYDSALIKKLQKDHKKLLKIFSKIEKKPSKNILDTFKEEFNSHRILEDPNLYTYIQIKHSSESLDILEKIKNDIEKIFKKLDLISNSLSKNEDCHQHIKETKEQLIQLIQIEEEILFSVYEYFFFKYEKITKEKSMITKIRKFLRSKKK